MRLLAAAMLLLTGAAASAEAPWDGCQPSTAFLRPPNSGSPVTVGRSAEPGPDFLLFVDVAGRWWLYLQADGQVCPVGSGDKATFAPGLLKPLAVPPAGDPA